ncbi:RNA polymerase sigma-70 factor (ECF subfamily) [Comamonas sp. BIGb0124]|uniref:RNA polymerase sigma factor n=1 Tax=Comamonas sp. BIGb0124 TaxID=2485130 RepID=UPI000F4857BA|nr:sigma-70 family RNA polymerase sigma factor [Comamonas sp. BIGb0124]ROR20739.1 RNA polymerase sigma-70 factor (ECF subfamily) [Comamonas sp. BIGb0124]
MIERYYRELLSHFSRRTRSAENAADIVQEAYSRVIAVQQSGSAIAEPRALLYRTARNILIDQHRRSTAHGEHVSLHDDAGDALAGHLVLHDVVVDPEASLAAAQAMQSVLRIIDRLPLRCREAFILHKFDGLTQVQVAQHMGISLKAVEQHIRNAMQACRQVRERPPDPPSPAKNTLSG